MKCHAGVEFESGKPCPKCNAKLGEVCWPGINKDLMDVQKLRTENERLRKALQEIVQVGGQDLCRGIATEALAVTSGNRKSET